MASYDVASMGQLNSARQFFQPAYFIPSFIEFKWHPMTWRVMPGPKQWYLAYQPEEAAGAGAGAGVAAGKTNGQSSSKSSSKRRGSDPKGKGKAAAAAAAVAAEEEEESSRDAGALMHEVRTQLFQSEAFAKLLTAGRGRYCSPRHRMWFDSRNGG